MLVIDALLCDVIPILNCQNERFDMIEQVAVAYTVGGEHLCNCDSTRATCDSPDREGRHRPPVHRQRDLTKRFHSAT